ncbi:heparanase-like [Littorina saxatilis]|uniref:Heparanase n=1 Tax=Littorina saxatilis TaxID=31220 RepID=A0AAN9G3E9_9CAEN
MLTISTAGIIMTLCLLKSAEASSVRFFSVDRTQQKDGAPPSGKSKAVDEPIVVNVNLQQSFSTIDDRFVGVTLDLWSLLDTWGTLDFNSRQVQNMARALAPCYFRLGGGGSDSMTFVVDDIDTHLKHPVPNPPLFNLTATQWIAVNEFVQAVGWDFIFDFNALKRNADGSWNPDNARQLLQFSADRNYTIVGFQLGNEYEYFPGNYQKNLSAEQYAKDTVSLRQLLTEFPNYYSSFITGPETVNTAVQYFKAYLAAGAYKTVRAASFHQYYFAAPNGALANFTDVQVMDLLVARLDDVIGQASSVDPQLPLWLTETSSAALGGMFGVSDRFVAGFLWLDKLGLCASRSIQTVIRQDFYGGNYSLIDANLNPNPDFWLTVLYKRIVRGAVFHATGRHDVRVYAACANTDNFPAGSLVVYMLNPNNCTVTFDLRQFNTQPRFSYSLTAGDSDGLVSKFMALNGVKLELVNDELPDLKPESAPRGVVTVPAYSYTFLVFPEAGVSICLH